MITLEAAYEALKFTRTEFLVLNTLTARTLSGRKAGLYPVQFDEALNQLKNRGLINFKILANIDYSLVWWTKTGVELMLPSGSSYPWTQPSSRYQPRAALPESRSPQVKTKI